ncbi:MULTISPECIES: hemagglutinin [Providencia]|uniref:Hemagglutinin n=1 Tax=Providencia huaxiensis TaxID=2027290 RepID=A0ABU2J4T8_9GAMM|nr:MULTISPECIES: hemagglutinin [Providencia]HEK2766120.1 hypothetical protein [Proteus mirabilis]EIU7559075.1 hypothetical protein [Providencia rettgeri]ELR5267974.1 hypothetical protein [Providencia rettgeri]MCG5276047.1 hypothetical protein [Providencia rettgeri]MDB9569264.1 hypothetical protein [Providencia rettgeri]
MAYEIYAECPCCEVTADSINEIEEVFGFRIVQNGEKIPQSYCKICRGLRCSPDNKKCQKI